MRTMKVPTEVTEDSRVLRERRLLFPTSDRLETWLIPLERPDLDNTTSQPWSQAIYPCTTSASAYLLFVTIFLLEKTRQSTRSGGTGASCISVKIDHHVSNLGTRGFLFQGVQVHP